MSVAHVAVPVALPGSFDYWVPQGVPVAVGAIVRVRFGRRRHVGVVLGVSDSPSVDPDRVQPIEELLALPPLPADLLELAAFVTSYYQESPGLACELLLPPLGEAATGIRARASGARLTDAGRAAFEARAPKGAGAMLRGRLDASPEGLDAESVRGLPDAEKRALAKWRRQGYVEEARPADAAPTALPANADQRAAIDAIVGGFGGFETFLLHGVTGSGKTEVYLAAAAAAIAAGGQVLLLVPEINLTPQLEARIAAALPRARIATLHSGLASGARRQHWLDAARGDADLVIGTRLAVFAPMPRLSLVVVDEEHDPSFKQREGVRYHARDCAVWRARRRAVPIVLGSATPSLESYAHAQQGRYRRLALPSRADPRAALPTVRFVPARGDHVHDGLSEALRQALVATLARREQSLVFVNRRGYSPSLKCSACAWEAGCPRCSARLVVHRAPAGLRCHHCGHAERIPPACPSCGNVDLMPRGHGTQRLERALADALPGARIARVDRDTVARRGAFEAVRERVGTGDVDVLVGTQMLAKGHDFPRLTLVGVLGADNALYSADFRAAERLAALLMQVAGRAGRAEHPGEVVVQTDFPAHPVYASLAAHDYDAFARTELAEREAAGLPPFAYLALVSAEAHARAEVDAFLAQAHEAARRLIDAGALDVEAFPPVIASLARRAGFERAQMLLRSRRRTDLSRLLAALKPEIAGAVSRRVRVAIDVDPDGLA